jgi:ubiquitin carboxyl-terminal hydrolase 47
MVYELYSILIHSGGPHHGHYYAYIRSSEDGKWYCFNDYKVTELNVQEMLSTVFGGKGGTNAYGLYYRQVDKEVKIHEPIPEEIAKQLEEELAKAQQIKEEKIQNEDKYIKLKLAYQLYVKTVEVMNTMTLKDLLERAKAAFGADHFKDIQPKNMRLRLFNPVNEMKMDTFTGREDRTLELLRIGSHKCLLLETKR